MADAINYPKYYHLSWGILVINNYVDFYSCQKTLLTKAFIFTTLLSCPILNAKKINLHTRKTPENFLFIQKMCIHLHCDL